MNPPESIGDDDKLKCSGYSAPSGDFVLSEGRRRGSMCASKALGGHIVVCSFGQTTLLEIHVKTSTVTKTCEKNIPLLLHLRLLLQYLDLRLGRTI